MNRKRTPALETLSRPSCPVPTVVEIIEVDPEAGLVTFRHKRRIHTWPIDAFDLTFPGRRMGFFA